MVVIADATSKSNNTKMLKVLLRLQAALWKTSWEATLRRRVKGHWRISRWNQTLGRRTLNTLDFHRVTEEKWLQRPNEMSPSFFVVVFTVNKKFVL